MKHLLLKVLEGILIVLSIFVLGLLPSTFISAFLTITTDIEFMSCVMTGPFWFFSLLGWLFSSVYINEVVKQIN
jgi:hypothetical protein